MAGKSVLVIAAHPDDEVIGAGGVIAAHAADGDAVYIAILTEGASVQFPGDVEKAALKKRQAAEVAGLLGARELFTGDFPDQRLDVTPQLEVNRFVEGVARKVNPNIIYTHHFAELNADHRAAYEAAAVAARPFSLPSFERLLCYAVDTLTHAGQAAPRFNCYFDITETLELKLRAMRVYETELRDYPHPRSLEALRHAALCAGAAVGLRAAEAFESVLEVRRG
ncbi:MAG TPA: PIG-L deacetylase family protein [Pyrinomonadaceae bacterium]|jgi:LmbE family N-acetylglucosaminyl deacetylase|nr:PIG-L deacetylase family protein [Pyrinomonadaceae bacterium]